MFVHTDCFLNLSLQSQSSKRPSGFAKAALISFLNSSLFVRFIAGLKMICKGKVEC